jgi:hypothetical protein
MYNPLSLINPALMEALLKEPRFFVRQYYERGKTGTEIPLLLTYYHKEDEKDPLRANLHMKLLKDDKYRFLYDSEIEEHHKKLMTAAAQPQGFRVYINLLPKKWKASNELRKKLTAYAKQHFQWWPREGPVNIGIQLQDLYGQLYLLVNWQGHRAEILLDNVEKMDENVL